jgi:RHS repeat-associated protein
VGNLSWRTNNAFWENFQPNPMNELTNFTRATSNLTVAGTTTSVATSVMVNGLAASTYADATSALGGFTVTNGSNTFTATAKDSYGRQSTNTVTVDLPSSASYSYDLNGNLTGDGNRTFAYDDENQLKSVYVTNVWQSDFVYDGKMRLRERFESVWVGSARVTNGATLYVYDGNLVIQERNANNLPLVTYTRGRDLSGTFEGAGGIGGLLARTDSSMSSVQPSAAHDYYHADGNGNITCLINSQQAIVGRYLYDPFGNILSQSGSLAAANLYRFSSKEFHVNSGLVYYLYRFYDPNLQRWINRDPLEEAGGPNLFTFVANNPTTRADPFGLVSAACAQALQQLANASRNFADAPGPLTAYVLNEAIDAVAAACGPNTPPMPPPQPFPVYTTVCEPGYRQPPGLQPPQHQSFCQRHPNWCAAGVVAGGVLVAGGVTALCFSQPELCLGGIRIGITILRGAAPVLGRAGGLAP